MIIGKSKPRRRELPTSPLPVRMHPRIGRDAPRDRQWPPYAVSAIWRTIRLLPRTALQGAHAGAPPPEKDYLRRDARRWRARIADLLLRLQVRAFRRDQRRSLGRWCSVVRFGTAVRLQGLRQKRRRCPAEFRLGQEAARGASGLTESGDMKFKEDRPLANVATAVRNLLEIAQRH